MIISIIIIVFITTLFVSCLLVTGFKLLNIKKKDQYNYFNKLAKIQFARYNNFNTDINNNLFTAFSNDILENAYTILDKIV